MEKGDLIKLLLNIMFEISAPTKSQRLDIPSLVGILSLVNLAGIMNYLSYYQHQSVPPMVESSTTETRDLFSGLLTAVSSAKGGHSDNQNLNPQTLMMILNLLSNLNKKKSDEISEPQVSAAD
ncbi:MAG: hypothetical protein GXX09_08440 [Syntrophomonadaceae bacterium]|nr:hypothetical protein [Syntrophomonadaceae bacterium]